MRGFKRVLLAASVAGVFSMCVSAQAQSGNPDAYLAASPRLLKMLQERTAFARTPANLPGNGLPAAVPSKLRPGNNEVVASPRLQQQWSEQRHWTVVPPAADVASAGYRPTGADGITASPKLREQLEAHPGRLIIAPVK